MDASKKLQSLHTLRDLDAKFVRQYVMLKDAFINLRSTEQQQSQEEIQWVTQTIIHTGSSAEGTHLARWFARGLPYIEADLMFPAGKLPYSSDSSESESSQLVPVKERCGSYLIRNDDQLRTHIHAYLRSIWDKNFHEASEKFSENSQFRKWLPASVVKAIMKRNIRFRNRDEEFNDITSKLFGYTIGDVVDKTAIEGPSASVSVRLCDVNNTVIAELSGDTVVCFELDRWPDEAMDWLDRANRKWPDKEAIRTMQSVPCHIVPKCNQRESDPEFGNVQWRISFAGVEKKLAEHQTPYQRMCYLILKLIHYEYLKNIPDEPQEGSSYLLKTTFFWCLEDKDQSFWELSRLQENLTYVMEKFTGFVKLRYIPQFIMPRLNLLENFSRTFLEKLEKLSSSLCKKNLLELLDQDRLDKLIVDATRLSGLADMLVFGTMFASECVKFKNMLKK